MSTYGRRLVSFSSKWPHASPSPKDLAEAGFSYCPTSELPDNVICKLCNTQLCDWEPADDPMQEHYRCSKSCIRFTSGSDPTLIFVQDAMALPQKYTQASAQADLPAPQIAPQASLQISQKALKPSTKDIGFLDPSLQHDFPELCLFHDAHVFCDRIERCRSESGFLGADILALLPKCLRGEALTWFRSQSECQDLASCIVAMRARFSQALPQEALQESLQASSQAPPQAISQSACQTPDYHHCKLCNASFSSMARLIRHTQENICNKPSCRQCDMVFLSNNQLHRHLREECQKHKQSSSKSSSKSSSRSSSRSSSTWPSPSSTAYSSTCSPIFSPAPSPTPSPPPRHRAISPPPNHLTVADLLTRYAKPPCLNVDDLFRMFGRRSARSSTVPFSARSVGVTTAPAVASKHPIRHRGRCQAKKGDGSTQAAKHLTPSKTPKTTTKPKQQQNQKQKIGFARTSLQQIPCKSVLLLQRSRSLSCPIAASGSPSFLASSALKLATCNASDPRCLTLQCIRSPMHRI